MNYQRVYNNLILNAQSKNRIKETYYKRKKENLIFIYYENHHIVPKCMNGDDNKENKVLLTAKEHYICHNLLTYIYPNNRKIACAFYRMTYNKNKNKISSRNYAYAKELLNLIPMSEETKKKISNAQKGRKRSEKFKENVRKGMLGINKGRIHIEQSRINMSIAHQGKKLKPFTKEHKEKIQLSNKGKIHVISEEGRQRMKDAAKKRIPWNKGIKQKSYMSIL